MLFPKQKRGNVFVIRAGQVPNFPISLFTLCAADQALQWQGIEMRAIQLVLTLGSSAVFLAFVGSAALADDITTGEQIVKS